MISLNVILLLFFIIIYYLTIYELLPFNSNLGGEKLQMLVCFIIFANKYIFVYQETRKVWYQIIFLLITISRFSLKEQDLYKKKKFNFVRYTCIRKNTES